MLRAKSWIRNSPRGPSMNIASHSTSHAPMMKRAVGRAPKVAAEFLPRNCAMTLSVTGRQSVYQYRYIRSPDQDVGSPVSHPIVVVGAGPVGLTAAIDLALRGVRV